MINKKVSRTIFIAALFLILGINIACATIWPDQTEKKYFSIPKESKTVSIDINKYYSDSIIPLDYHNKITSLSLDANFSLNDTDSYFRVILIDNNRNEYLIFEASNMIYTENFVQDICEETCNLPDIIPDSIRIESEDSSIYISSLNIQKSDSSTKKMLISRQEYKQKQKDIKIKRLNEHIKSEGLDWIAAETSVSDLSYAEKKALFGLKSGENMPNTYGFEYYSGGIFEIRTSPYIYNLLNSSTKPSPGNQTDVPPNWDWRNVSGENWMTPVKNQGNAGTCFAFSLIGTMESQVNIYYNQHLNLDLSEQQLADCMTNTTLPLSMSNSKYPACGGLNTCYPGYNACVISQHGISDESCDPYAQRNINTPGNCSLKNICSDWQSRIWKNSGFWDYKFVSDRGTPNCKNQTMNLNESAFKRLLIEKGPLDSGINVWHHAMVLVGYINSPNGTVWIFKNSWGTAWGEAGYGYIRIALNDTEWGSSVIGPFIPPTNKTYWPTGFNGSIKCVDKDLDGYCNWGITNVGIDATWRKNNCPSSCLYNPKKDCDDSNRRLFGFDQNDTCQKVTLTVVNRTRACVESDWTYYLVPTMCKADQVQRKFWTKINNCTGGIQHSTYDIIKCYPLLA